MPRGKLPYGPFLPRYELVPPDATNRRQIQCSPALEAHLTKFYEQIQPLLTITALASAPPSTLYAEWHLTREARWMPIVHCCTFAIREKCALYRALGIADPAADPALEDTHLRIPICELDLLSMADSFLELNIWACIMQVLIKFIGLARSANAYFDDVIRRCSVWDKMHTFGILFHQDIRNLSTKRNEYPSAGRTRLVVLRHPYF
ncbi:hypothetical protein B0H17DRAFT_1140023 [Mycena rosella]|uniref:Uncharacterized protein n=1 Tax=Mycena rosella TaxID=1033263 RepID=A0AAD7D4D7_MYCRO|nr:hypothetical protein B0H17DRAFT_1140023 [Mycena rosella]